MNHESSAAPALEQVLADFRGEASVLRRSGHRREAVLVDRICDTVSKAQGIPEYLTWLSEQDAMTYEGLKHPDSLRARFAELEARHLAKWEGRRRLYRAIGLRHRGCPEAARAAGLRAGKAAAA